MEHDAEPGRRVGDGVNSGCEPTWVKEVTVGQTG